MKNGRKVILRPSFSLRKKKKKGGGFRSAPPLLKDCLPLGPDYGQGAANEPPLGCLRYSQHYSERKDGTEMIIFIFIPVGRHGYFQSIVRADCVFISLVSFQTQCSYCRELLAYFSKDSCSRNMPHGDNSFRQKNEIGSLGHSCSWRYVSIASLLNDFPLSS